MLLEHKNTGRDLPICVFWDTCRPFREVRVDQNAVVACGSRVRRGLAAALPQLRKRLLGLLANEKPREPATETQ